jgi:hypothetical protein
VKEVDSTGIAHLYVVTTAGTTGSASPKWPSNGDVHDGSVVWSETKYNAVDFPFGTFDTFTSIVDPTATVVAGAGGTAIPIVTACGDSPTLDSYASAHKGTITEGRSASGCTITWHLKGIASYGIANPECTLSSPSGATYTSYSVTPYALKIVNPLADGNKYTWICE